MGRMKSIQLRLIGVMFPKICLAIFKAGQLDGERCGYIGAAMVADLNCHSMGPYYADKSKRECFDDLHDHYRKCADSRQREYRAAMGRFDQWSA